MHAEQRDATRTASQSATSALSLRGSNVSAEPGQFMTTTTQRLEAVCWTTSLHDMAGGESSHSVSSAFALLIGRWLASKLLGSEAVRPKLPSRDFCLANDGALLQRHRGVSSGPRSADEFVVLCWQLSIHPLVPTRPDGRQCGVAPALSRGSEGYRSKGLEG